MTENQRKECHEHAWKHFTIHSQQRMTSVQFFIALCTVILGGIAVLLKDSTNTRLVGLLAFALPIFAFIFWKLDERNRQLIRAAEAALRHLENNDSGIDSGGQSHPLKIFTAEESATAELKRKKYLWVFPSHFSYTTCFRLIFLLFGAGGFVFGFILLFR